jgi:hypothetical protein
MQHLGTIVSVSVLLSILFGTGFYVLKESYKDDMYRTPSEIANFDRVTESLEEAQNKYDAIRPNWLLDMETQPPEEKERMRRLVGHGGRKTKRKYSKRKKYSIRT